MLTVFFLALHESVIRRETVAAGDRPEGAVGGAGLLPDILAGPHLPPYTQPRPIRPQGSGTRGWGTSVSSSYSRFSRPQSCALFRMVQIPEARSCSVMCSSSVRFKAQEAWLSSVMCFLSPRFRDKRLNHSQSCVLHPQSSGKKMLDHPQFHAYLKGQKHEAWLYSVMWSSCPRWGTRALIILSHAHFEYKVQVQEAWPSTSHVLSGIRGLIILNSMLI